MDLTKPYNIYWDAENQWVVMDWTGYATSAQFIEGVELMYNLIKKHNAFKVLANIKDMTLISLQDQNYTVYSFLPRAIEAGFRAIAVVRPVSYFNAVAIESMGYRVNQTTVQMRVFHQKADALEWLREFKV